MKKFLLLGHNGYLGSYLLNSLDCDILEGRELYNNSFKYQFIINCIGKPDLEYCELNQDETLYSNALIIEDIKNFYPESKIINFSSYYVYNDIGLCNEESNTTIKYAYCRQKILGEQLNINGLNFRIGKLFGNHLSSQNKLTEYILKNDRLEIDTVTFNPTSVYCISELLKNYDFLNENFGIYNLSNRGIVSHYDYALFINNFLNDIKLIIKSDKNIRPFENYGKFTMDISKINKLVYIERWENDMKNYLQKVGSFD